MPARFAGAQVTLKAYPDRLCIHHGEGLIARHARDAQILQRFLTLTTLAVRYYAGLVERRSHALVHVRKIVALADIYGNEAVVRALTDALSFGPLSRPLYRCVTQYEYAEHAAALRKSVGAGAKLVGFGRFETAFATGREVRLRTFYKSTTCLPSVPGQWKVVTGVGDLFHGQRRTPKKRQARQEEPNFAFCNREENPVSHRQVSTGFRMAATQERTVDAARKHDTCYVVCATARYLSAKKCGDHRPWPPRADQRRPISSGPERHTASSCRAPRALSERPACGKSAAALNTRPGRAP